MEFKNNKNKILKQISKIEAELKKLYKKYPKEELSHYTLYIPIPTDNPASKLNRVSPYAPAIDRENWPMWEDDDFGEGGLLKHVLSLDLRSVPKVKERIGEDANVMSLFLSSYWENNAYEPETKESYVMFHNVTEGEFLPEELKDDDEIAEKETFYFDVAEIEVPKMILIDDEDLDEIDIEDYNPEESLDNKLLVDYYNFREENDVEDWEKFPGRAVKDMLMELPCFIGGTPIWLQYPEHKGTFIMQFSEPFADIGMGDSGEMYVFTDTAFWQSC